MFTLIHDKRGSRLAFSAVTRWLFTQCHFLQQQKETAVNQNMLGNAGFTVFLSLRLFVMFFFFVVFSFFSCLFWRSDWVRNVQTTFQKLKLHRSLLEDTQSSVIRSWAELAERFSEWIHKLVIRSDYISASFLAHLCGLSSGPATWTRALLRGRQGKRTHDSWKPKNTHRVQW